MSDVTQGVQAPDDAALFSDATTTTLEKFENAEPLPPQPEIKKPDPPQEVKPEVKPEQPDAMVPSGRLREANEAKQRAERERDDLMRQLAATRVPPQQQQPQQKPDMFENPSGFVQHEVGPYFAQVQAQLRMQAEAFSEQMASSAYGREKVDAAKQALTEGMHRADPEVKAVWQRAMDSPHPYDVITRWHLNNQTMREIGGDLNGYKQRILEEALKDPEYRRRAIEASKGDAQHVARPVSSVPRIPSLGNVGAGGEAELQEPSDEQLFRAATTAKRR